MTDTNVVTDNDCLRAREAYLQCGSHSLVGAQLGISRHASRRRVQRAEEILAQRTQAPDKELEGFTVTEDGDGRVLSAKGQIKTLEELLAAAEVDLAQWAVTKTVVNKWDAYAGQGEIMPLWQVKAWLERKPDYALHPIQPVKHLHRQYSPQSTKKSFRSALIVPDSQNGYHFDPRTGKLDPLHDRKAWDLAVQMAEHVQPNVIVLLGDMLDLAPWSTKYPTPPSLRYTTQPSLLELHWWIGQLRLAAPKASIVYLEGNHESRLQRALVDKLDEAIDLRPIEDPDGHPFFSIPRMLSLDSLDVRYMGPYGKEFWLWDEICIHHGNVVRKGGGATTQAMIREATSSEIVGHIHRLEMAGKTFTTSEGQKTIYAMSPGTLCRTDGVVPATSSRLDWQQGLGMVYLNENTGQISMSPIPIQSGSLMWGGRAFFGEDRVKDIREATGWSSF